MSASQTRPLGLRVEQAEPARQRSPRSRLEAARDIIGSADPGLNRLFSALELTIAIAVTIGVIYVFMQVTHAMWVKAPVGVTLPPAQITLLDAQHHGITLLAMLLGGVIAMMSAFAVLETKRSQQALTISLMPLPVLATMALAVELAAHHALGIAVLAIVMGFGTYMRRWIPRIGPRAFVYGAELFIGYIFGFLSRGAITEGELGWIAVILCVACATNFVLKRCVAAPLARGRLDRIARAFRARCRAAMGAATALFDATDEREQERSKRRLQRALTRVNETALVIDASIADPDATPLGAAAFDAHDELFELELLVQNLGRIAEQLSAAALSAGLRTEIRHWLADLKAGHVSRAAAAARTLDQGDAKGLLTDLSDEDELLVHRLATTIVATQSAARAWPRHHRALSGADEDGAAFESPVSLMFGDLPGSALVTVQATAPPDNSTGWSIRRLWHEPPAQAAIRMAVAVGVAAAIGSVVSERRFYWAVIAVFITFMGTNTSGEQITKAANRVLGTVVGILIGSLLAHAVGVSSWSIAVMILALAIGIYFMKVSYGLMVIGITVTVAQLYAQLGEFSNHLLVLRLEETAIGAAVAVLCSIVIFPVATRRVATVAAVGYLQALTELLERVRSRLVEADDDGGSLTSASRALDYAAQQFRATTRPLRYTQFRPDRLEHNVALVSQTAHHGRNLVAEVERHRTFEPLSPDDVAAALQTEHHAATALMRTLETGNGSRGRPQRLDDHQLAALDRTLDDAGVPPWSYQYRLLHGIDRLDETLAELHRNLAGQT